MDVSAGAGHPHSLLFSAFGPVVSFYIGLCPMLLLLEKKIKATPTFGNKDKNL